MLSFADEWVWDFWLADAGDSWHLFYLHAPRALGDPELRHAHATVGHAVSADLRAWEPRGEALGPGAPGEFDETATWTGSVVCGDDGAWRMFYTGMSLRRGVRVQRIGVAVSADLERWTKLPQNPVLEPDARWYERHGDSGWPDDAWRDPWVLRDPGGDGWHMLLTARARVGRVDQRGVIGHARSTDLVRWEAGAPLTDAAAGFGHLEVPQVAVVDGRPVLVFSCRRAELGGRRAGSGGPGGVWTAPAASPTGPFDIADARLLVNESLYAGRLVRTREGGHVLLAFRNRLPDGSFGGELSDPMPVAWDGSRLVLRDGS